MSADSIIIFGCSDDLIEVAGLINDELDPAYCKPMLVTVMVDDATYASVRIEFDPDRSGEWRIQAANGSEAVTVVEARHTDDGDYDDDGCPGYSDKAYVDMGDIERRRISVSAAEVTE